MIKLHYPKRKYSFSGILNIFSETLKVHSISFKYSCVNVHSKNCFTPFALKKERDVKQQ